MPLGKIAHLTNGWRSATLHLVTEPLDPSSAVLLAAGDALELAPLAPVRLPAVTDLLIPGDSPVRVRVYTPDVLAPRGALVWLHPGGFVGGELDDIDGVCRALAADGRCTVVSVDYRLAPAHPFPAAVQDTLAVLAWLKAHSATLGVDAARIAAGGQSAGATIVAGALLALRDRGEPLPCLQVLAYPVLDPGLDAPSYAENDGKLFTVAELTDDWHSYLGGSPPSPYAAPLLAPTLAGLPSTLLLGAGHDPARDDTRRYAARLSDAGVPAELIEYGGALHAFLSFPAVLPVALHALGLIAARLRDALGIREPRLHHVGLTYPPGREALVRHFYGELLGLTEKPLPAVFSARGFVWFAAGPGESELHLIADRSQADHSPRHACLITDRLDELTGRLRDAGYEVERHNGIVGRPQTFLRDPFGNMLELSRLLADYA
jgi:acetyl esterase